MRGVERRAVIQMKTMRDFVRRGRSPNEAGGERQAPAVRDRSGSRTASPTTARIRHRHLGHADPGPAGKFFGVVAEQDQRLRFQPSLHPRRNALGRAADKQSPIIPRDATRSGGTPFYGEQGIVERNARTRNERPPLRSAREQLFDPDAAFFGPGNCGFTRMTVRDGEQHPPPNCVDPEPQSARRPHRSHRQGDFAAAAAEHRVRVRGRRYDIQARRPRFRKRSSRAPNGRNGGRFPCLRC